MQEAFSTILVSSRASTPARGTTEWEDDRLGGLGHVLHLVRRGRHRREEPRPHVPRLRHLRVQQDALRGARGELRLPAHHHGRGGLLQRVPPPDRVRHRGRCLHRVAGRRLQRGEGALQCRVLDGADKYLRERRVGRRGSLGAAEADDTTRATSAPPPPTRRCSPTSSRRCQRHGARRRRVPLRVCRCAAPVAPAARPPALADPAALEALSTADRRPCSQVHVHPRAPVRDGARDPAEHGWRLCELPTVPQRSRYDGPPTCRAGGALAVD